MCIITLPVVPVHTGGSVGLAALDTECEYFMLLAEMALLAEVWTRVTTW